MIDKNGIIIKHRDIIKISDEVFNIQIEERG